MPYTSFVEKNIEGILPVTIDKDVEYYETLDSLLTEYENAVKKEPLLKTQKNKIKSLSNCLRQAVKLYYEGKTAEAYEKIKNFTDKFDGFNACKKQMKDIVNGFECTTLYRGRVAEEINDLEEMFHRPFSQRPYIPTERYSIPGLPCLYLASSVYTCWKEIGKPNFNEFFVSRFQAKEDVTVLNLAIHPKEYNFKQNENIQELYCIIWPLICACSFKIKEKNRTFRSEYIIPQLLMQIVINRNDIDGIRYLSSYLPQNIRASSPHIYVDYAFPAPYEKDEKYSSILASKFALTSPICMHDFNQLSPNNQNTVIRSGPKEGDCYIIKDLCKKPIERLDGEIEVAKGRISHYDDTTYSKIEKFLCKLNVEELVINKSSSS